MDLKVWRIFLPDNRLRAQSLSDSLQVDPRAQVRWKDGDSSYDVQLSVHWWLPPFNRNLRRKKHAKIALTPRLPGVITLPSELRFAQTLYCWKVDIESFPKICCMTHFEHRKASKTASRKSGQKRVRAQKSRRIRWGACVEDKTATWRAVRLARHHHAPRGMMPREACNSVYKSSPTPTSFVQDFARALGSLSVRIGRNRGFRGP
uniref:Uncharacterized protein n=1 Tax=Fagus sylvatica TaxID=28930 RepID=A0A2N9GQ56_FAGSY